MEDENHDPAKSMDRLFIASLDNDLTRNDLTNIDLTNNDLINSDLTHNVPSYEDDPNYYYNFVMDDEDPVAAVERNDLEIGGFLSIKKEKPPISEKYIGNLEDSFHTNLINNIICNKDPFNDQPEYPKTDDDIYESLNNYILGRGQSLQNTTEGLAANKKRNHEFYDCDSTWKTQNASGEAENIFIMDVSYNPKLTDDFVCGSFTNAVKTPLTKMYTVKDANSAQNNHIPQGLIGNNMWFVHTSQQGKISLITRNPPKNQNSTNKKMSFADFINNTISTINYNVIEFNGDLDFSFNSLNKNLIYALRFKRIFGNISLELKNIKTNYIEFDNCFKLKNLQLSNSGDFTVSHLKGIIFNDTPLIHISQETRDCLFTPNLANLFISFSESGAGGDSYVKFIRNIESFRGETHDNYMSEKDRLLRCKYKPGPQETFIFRELNTITLSAITSCVGLKMLCLSGCNLTGFSGVNECCGSNELGSKQHAFILPPNLREFWAINTKFSGKFVLPQSLFVLRLIDCDISNKEIADSLEYLPDTLYRLHIENNFCVTEFLRKREQPLPPALQKIYCNCCDFKISNNHSKGNYNMIGVGSRHNIKKLTSFAKLNEYCVGDLLHSAKYPGLKYYLDMFYRDPIKKLYENIHPSELYSCHSNYILDNPNQIRPLNLSYPTEYIHHDLRIMDITKRIKKGRTILVWALSQIVAETYDGKLPKDLIKYIAFTAYPLLGIDKYARFKEYESLEYCDKTVTGGKILHYETIITAENTDNNYDDSDIDFKYEYDEFMPDFS